MLPLARTAAAAGHTVTLTGPLSLAPTVRQAGLTFVSSGPDVTPQRGPLQPLMEHEYRVVGEHFAGRLARARAAELNSLCQDQRPDVIVRDEMDFGSVVVAERVEIPHASVIVIAAGSFVKPALVAEPLNRLRADYGLPADPDLAMLTRNLVLAGVRQLPTEVVLTVGRGIDPAEFGIQPRHVHVEQYIPQSMLLPDCVALLNHAGSGSGPWHPRTRTTAGMHPDGR